jgi:hypothetical protein
MKKFGAQAEGLCCFNTTTGGSLSRFIRAAVTIARSVIREGRGDAVAVAGTSDSVFWNTASLLQTTLWTFFCGRMRLGSKIIDRSSDFFSLWSSAVCPSPGIFSTCFQPGRHGREEFRENAKIFMDHHLLDLCTICEDGFVCRRVCGNFGFHYRTFRWTVHAQTTSR